MSQDKKQYVYRLMKAECSCGSKDFQQYLNLPEDHGITFSTEDQPLMNASDHVANENILQFGRCTSLTNPRSIVCKKSGRCEMRTHDTGAMDQCG